MSGMNKADQRVFEEWWDSDVRIPTAAIKVAELAFAAGRAHARAGQEEERRFCVLDVTTALAHAGGAQEPAAYILSPKHGISRRHVLIWPKAARMMSLISDNIDLTALYTAPPAESEEVARLLEALHEIRELNMAVSEDGSCWAVSDMIEQTIVAALAARSAPADHIADAGKPITSSYRKEPA